MWSLRSYRFIVAAGGIDVLDAIMVRYLDISMLNRIPRTMCLYVQQGLGTNEVWEFQVVCLIFVDLGSKNVIWRLTKRSQVDRLVEISLIRSYVEFMIEDFNLLHVYLIFLLSIRIFEELYSGWKRTMISLFINEEFLIETVQFFQWVFERLLAQIGAA